MWKKREAHILDIYKNDQLVIEQKLIRKTDTQHSLAANEKNKIYQGNEFDVFGKDCIEEFAPLYSKEQFTPKNKEKMDETKRDILLRTEQKRGQTEAMFQHTSIIKKRKMSPITTTASTPPNHLFIKSTAAINSPIASIFVDPKQDHEDGDLAYY
jgi:hypothetical protein